MYIYVYIYIHTSTLTHSRTHIHTLTEDGEEDERNLMGTDCLQKFARAVGVEVAPEPGLMVLRRRAAPGRAWAVENLVEEVLFVYVCIYVCMYVYVHVYMCI